MAAVAVTSVNAVAQLFPGLPGTVARNRKLLVAVTAGQSVYIDPTTGSAGLTSTNTAGAHNHTGIAMRTGGIGDVVVVVEEGEIGGFNLSASNYNDLIYAQDIAGNIGTTAGTTTVVIGRVVPLTDGVFGNTASKVLRLIRNQITTF
jgi:hypothetical protein